MLRVCLLAIVLGCSTAAMAEEMPDFGQGGLPFLEKHCIECHRGDKPKGEISLDKFRDSASLVQNRKVWETIVKVVRAGDMPPAERPEPEAAEVEAFLTHAASVFDYADRHAKPDPGRVTMRRLNRTEYRNTVRDLLGVDFDPTEGFPADDVGHGFDNIGDVLSLSPLLMERYLDAAETIASRVIMVNPPAPPSRYLSGRFLQPNNAETSQARFRRMDPLHAERVHSGPFTGNADYFKLIPDADLIFRANVYVETESKEPVKVALFINGANLENQSTKEEIATLLGADTPQLATARILGVFEITARDAANVQQIEVPVNHVANIQNAGIALVKPPEGQAPAVLMIEHLWTEGPLETRPPSHRMILACNPEATPAEKTQEVLTRLVRRAYRRPGTPEELARLTSVVEAEMAAGQKWEAGMQQAVMLLLCSPKFLFRVETDAQPENLEPQPLDEFQLATRLSYFLWSSMPDDELLDLAAKQQLTGQLDAQVRRMLLDPKSNELVRNFAMQWLQVQRLERLAPDATLFPTFDEPLRHAMLKETELFVASVLREDRSILDLVSADYTFLNEPLARHYGIVDTNGNLRDVPVVPPAGEPIQGLEFKRVKLQGAGRGGLLTQASVLTVTSNPTRTSPVKRGKWVLEQILGEPPPPPPPNVPELPNDAVAIAGQSLRQRLEQHRANISCANCHAKMDPIGFSLENFDAIGKFRVKDGTFDIDSTGEFADGTRVTGPGDLKTVVLQQRDQFARCLTEKMLTYALGRGLEYYDRRSIDQILTKLKAGDDKFIVLVSEIVQSEPFRLRRGVIPMPEEAAATP